MGRVAKRKIEDAIAAAILEEEGGNEEDVLNEVGKCVEPGGDGQTLEQAVAAQLPFVKERRRCRQIAERIFELRNNRKPVTDADWTVVREQFFPRVAAPAPEQTVDAAANDQLQGVLNGLPYPPKKFDVASRIFELRYHRTPEGPDDDKILEMILSKVDPGDPGQTVDAAAQQQLEAVNRKLSPHASRMIPVEEQHNLRPVIRVLRKAWEAPFKHEETITYFLHYIDEFAKVSDRYSNSLAIIQSSGTGKSRLIDEVARWRFTFAMCTRKDDPEGNASWPPPDRAIRDYLMGIREHPKVAVKFLLTALFEHTASELRRNSWADCPSSDLPERWKSNLAYSDGADAANHAPWRDVFFGEVTRTAKTRLDAYIRELKGLRPGSEDRDQGRTGHGRVSSSGTGSNRDVPVVRHRPDMWQLHVDKLRLEIDKAFTASVKDLTAFLSRKPAVEDASVEGVRKDLSKMSISPSALTSGAIEIIMSWRQG